MTVRGSRALRPFPGRWRPNSACSASASLVAPRAREGS